MPGGASDPHETATGTARQLRRGTGGELMRRRSSAIARAEVVVVGSGFGGLFCTRALRRATVDVTLVARTTHHLFQPLLYQVATGILSPGEIAPATREVLRRQRNATVLLGDVVDVDLARRTVTSVSFNGSLVTSYDYLVVAAGSSQSYFGHDDFAQYAPGMKTVDDALELRGRILGAFELAERANDDEERERLMTFVVVGAGPTGVEMAGQIAELARTALPGQFRRIDTRRVRILLVDAAPSVLPGMPAKLSRYATRRLERLGVEVVLGSPGVGVDDDSVTLEAPAGRRRIAASTKVWAAGVAASPLGALLAARAGVAVDHAGRVPVGDDLTLAGHPEVFVVGDMAATGLPGVAQAAIQGGRYAASQIDRRVRGRSPRAPFRYRDKGTLATVSRFSAVAAVGPVQLTGFVAWLTWLGVHLFYLIGFKNRVTTLLHWTITFVGSGRAERAITTQQVLGRVALQRLEQERARAGRSQSA